jgi:hypothetical protein
MAASLPKAGSFRDEVSSSAPAAVEVDGENVWSVCAGTIHIKESAVMPVSVLRIQSPHDEPINLSPEGGDIPVVDLLAHSPHFRNEVRRSTLLPRTHLARTLPVYLCTTDPSPAPVPARTNAYRIAHCLVSL